MKFYRLCDKNGIGLWSTIYDNNDNLSDLKCKLGAGFHSPFFDHNIYTKPEYWNKGKFYFTEKGYNKFKDIINQIIEYPDIILKIIKLNINDKAIIWHGKSGLQVSINESLLD